MEMKRLDGWMSYIFQNSHQFSKEYRSFMKHFIKNWNNNIVKGGAHYRKPQDLRHSRNWIVKVFKKHRDSQIKLKFTNLLPNAKSKFSILISITFPVWSFFKSFFCITWFVVGPAAVSSSSSAVLSRLSIFCLRLASAFSSFFKSTVFYKKKKKTETKCL